MHAGVRKPIKVMRIFKFNITRILSALFISAALVGCASTTDEEVPETLSEAEMYKMATQSIDGGQYNEAIKTLRTLGIPLSLWQLCRTIPAGYYYAYFMNYEPEAVRAAADRFLRLHPNHPNADYALYMKGLASNTSAMGLLERYLPLDYTKRDPGQARQSFGEFSELLNRYPDSRYAPDARQRMVALRNRLATYEIHAANYYMKRKAYVAATNRGRYVVEKPAENPRRSGGSGDYG